MGPIIRALTPLFIPRCSERPARRLAPQCIALTLARYFFDDDVRPLLLLHPPLLHDARPHFFNYLVVFGFHGQGYFVGEDLIRLLRWLRSLRQVLLGLEPNAFLLHGLEPRLPKKVILVEHFRPLRQVSVRMRARLGPLRQFADDSAAVPCLLVHLGVDIR